ncbi:MAG: hypothetical protein QRY72_04445 [Candidatus Rhabdochlamydia sp.]
MNSLFLSSLALITLQTAFAEDQPHAAYVRETYHPHQVMIVATPPPAAPQYEHRIGIGAGRMLYERTQNEDIYLGADVFATRLLARVSHPGKFHLHIHRYPSKTSLVDAEVRLGYNFLREGRDHFTPFGGVGFMKANIGVFQHAKFAYTAVGFKYLHELNSVFGWGFNIKGFAGQQISNQEAKKMGFGAEVTLPLCFRFARQRHWDVTVEPYYFYLESHHQHANTLGSKLTLAHRF